MPSLDILERVDTANNRLEMKVRLGPLDIKFLQELIKDLLTELEDVENELMRVEDK